MLNISMTYAALTLNKERATGDPSFSVQITYFCQVSQGMFSIKESANHNRISYKQDFFPFFSKLSCTLVKM